MAAERTQMRPSAAEGESADGAMQHNGPVEPLIVRETQMRPFCGPAEIAPHPSPLLPTRGRAMTSGAPWLGSAQPIQARRHFVARSGPAVAWSIRSHGTPVAFL